MAFKTVRRSMRERIVMKLYVLRVRTDPVTVVDATLSLVVHFTIHLTVRKIQRADYIPVSTFRLSTKISVSRLTFRAVHSTTAHQFTVLSSN